MGHGDFSSMKHTRGTGKEISMRFSGLILSGFSGSEWFVFLVFPENVAPSFREFSVSVWNRFTSPARR
jgi:hypothetical protein